MRAPEHPALGDLHSGVSCTRMACAHRPARAHPLTATRVSAEPMGVPEGPAGALQVTRMRVAVPDSTICTQIFSRTVRGCYNIPPTGSR